MKIKQFMAIAFYLHLIGITTVQSGIFDIVSGVVSSLPKQEAISSQDIQSQLDEIASQITTQVDELQEQEQGLKKQRIEVIRGQQATQKALDALATTRALPERVTTPLRQALSEQKKLLDDLQEVVDQSQRLMSRVITKQAPEVHQAIERVRNAVTNTNSVPEQQSTQPGNIISGIIQRLF